MRWNGEMARCAERSLLGLSLIGAVVAGLIAATPAAAAESMSGAEKIRRMDIMLMVTGLRCRTGANDFRADYGRFTSNHISELNQAAAELRGELAKRHGAAGAGRALDKLSVTMANSYGQGHPWLDCADLKMVASNLADVRGRATLEEAADQLLMPVSPPRFAYSRR